jgi:peptidoglycan/LPS O-acetylase OafA/YrhL
LDGVGHFYRNRALRILPIYVSAVVLTGALRSPEMFKLWDPNITFNTISLFLFDQRGELPIAALWSVSTEVQFYIAVPFLCIVMNTLIRRVRYALILIVIVAFSSVLLKYNALASHADWHSYVYFPLLANIDLFFIGLLAALIVTRLKRKLFVMRHGFYAGVAMTILMYLGLSYCSANWMVIATDAERVWFLGLAPAITSLFAALIIISFELADRSRSNSILSHFGWKITTNLGLMTYALYVWHEPILLSLRKIAPPTLSLFQSSTYLLLGGPLVLGIGWLFYRQLELPFDRLRHRKVFLNQ